jgi:hypothetical protein
LWVRRVVRRLFARRAAGFAVDDVVVPALAQV